MRPGDRAAGRAFVFACLALAACGGDSTGPGPGPEPGIVPTHLVMISAAPASQASGGTVAPAPVIELRDADNKVVAKPGVSVAASMGDAQLSGTMSAATGADGRATFGSLVVTGAPGAHQLTFASTGLAPVSATVPISAGAPARLVARSATVQNGLVSADVPAPPSVTVLDAANEPVPGVTVRFVITDGGGTVPAADVISDANGVATAASWRLGGTPGRNRVIAVWGADTVAFFSGGTLVPAVAISIVSGDSLTLSRGAMPGLPQVARVTTTDGSPVAGALVRFSPKDLVASLADSIAFSDDAGIVSSSGWHSVVTGQYLMQASLAPVGGPASVFRFFVVNQILFAIASGDYQAQVAGQPVPAAPQVKAYASAGPLRGVYVRFDVDGAGGQLTRTEAITGSDGMASPGSWTLAGAPGANSMAAVAPGASPDTVIIHAEGVTALPLSMAIARGDSQTVPIGSVAPIPPAVRVTDGGGNPVTGLPVHFQPGSGTVMGADAVTGTDGVAAVGSWTMGTTQYGDVVLVATSPSPAVASVQLHATAISNGPTQLVADPQLASGTVGQLLTPAPSFVVQDLGHTGLPGIPVTLAVTGGGGSVDTLTRVTNSFGRVTVVDWKMGTVPGTNSLTASVANLAPVTVSVAARAGEAASLAVVEGDNQSAEIWHAVPVQPAVQLRDQYGNLTQRPVTFVVTAGGGRTDSVLAGSGADGTVRMPWHLGRAPGTNTLHVAAQSNAALAVDFHATALPTSSPYNIDVRTIGSLTMAQQMAVDAAVTRWRVIITGDLAPSTVGLAANGCVDGQPALNETIDDIVIYVEIGTVDGPGNVLGAAGPCVLRATGGLPSVGAIQLDAADLSGMDQAELDDLVLHEMGHVLGFGTIWASPLLAGAGTSDPRFTGSSAIAGYHLLGGNQISVPVENTGGDGTADSHWRESVFGNELMTGFIGSGGNPLTGMTIGSMQDLGYSVDFASAEPLGFTVSFARAGVPSGPQLREMPLRSPILIMAPDGTVVGRRNR